MAYVPIVPGSSAAPAGQLVDSLGGQVLDLAVGVAPLAVPFVLGLAALHWAMEKFGLSARIELAAMDREAAAKEASRVARAERREARKQAKWDGMLDDAYTENRRRNLRKRVTGSYI